jgi:glycosyltransferase involved in cell wall biosynthesis
MMAELPVIVSDMFELKRFVEQHSVGLVTEVSDEGVQAAVLELVATDRRQYIANIRKVKSYYTWEEQETKLLRLYSELLGPDRPRRPGPSKTFDNAL